MSSSILITTTTNTDLELDAMMAEIEEEEDDIIGHHQSFESEVIDAVETVGGQIEDINTIDTNDPDQIQSFVDFIRNCQDAHTNGTPNQGQLLFEKISNLPVTSKTTGFGCTRTRVLKYLSAKHLLPESLNG